jgi:threonylcarbamoyladenosine tRNA methylthiotransferase MtaB
LSFRTQWQVRMSNPAEPPAATILTLGCKLNIADSEAIALDLRKAGWRVTERLSPDADAVIINSCSVTHVADRKSRHLLSQAKRLAPKATLAFTGCMVETAERSAIEALGADLVYRQVEQRELADRLIGLHPASPRTSDQRATATLRTRAFISAQEGCNDVCAFCIIPRTRGRERSRPVATIVQEARDREAEGAREIVVTGTQLGAYGREAGERTLHRVIEALLAKTTVPRIRISSVQPQDLSPRLVDLWQSQRLCRHFHLALQSGSETVLGRMRRRYTKAEYAASVEDLRRRIPGVAITTDVIAGFPGETDAEFDESYDFCRSMRFAAMHVFPYSNRRGTSAEKLSSQVGEPVKKERVRRLIELGDDLSREFRSAAVGSETDVLWETQPEDAVWEGLTDTYVRVRARSDRNLYNQLAPVRITGLSKEGLTGEMLS